MKLAAASCHSSSEEKKQTVNHSFGVPLFPWHYKTASTDIYSSNLQLWAELDEFKLLGCMELFIAPLLCETTVGRQAHNKHSAAVTMHAAPQLHGN